MLPKKQCGVLSCGVVSCIGMNRCAMSCFGAGWVLSLASPLAAAMWCSVKKCNALHRLGCVGAGWVLSPSSPLMLCLAVLCTVLQCTVPHSVGTGWVLSLASPLLRCGVLRRQELYCYVLRRFGAGWVLSLASPLVVMCCFAMCRPVESCPGAGWVLPPSSPLSAMLCYVMRRFVVPWGWLGFIALQSTNVMHCIVLTRVVMGFGAGWVLSPSSPLVR